MIILDMFVSSAAVYQQQALLHPYAAFIVCASVAQGHHDCRKICHQLVLMLLLLLTPTVLLRITHMHTTPPLQLWRLRHGR
jgi:hypothetical protein